MAEHPIAADRVVGTPITQAVLLITLWCARTQSFKRIKVHEGIEVAPYGNIFHMSGSAITPALRCEKLPENETRCGAAFLPTLWTHPGPGYAWYPSNRAPTSAQYSGHRTQS